MVWGGISHRVKSSLVVIVGNLTAIRCMDKILCPVAAPLVQHRNLVTMPDPM